MPEAEDVITDAARHATVFARALWQRGRPPTGAPAAVRLADVAQRLDLLVTAVFGSSMRFRTAEPPARPTLLARLFLRHEEPRPLRAVPATDGCSVWLPRDAGARSEAHALRYYRCMALTQAARAQRGAPRIASAASSQLVRCVYLLLEAHAVDRELGALLPGLAVELAAQRAEALAARPALARFPAARRPLEQLARHVLALPDREALPELCGETAPAALLAAAHELAPRLLREAAGGHAAAVGLLFLDAWTGDLRPTSARAELAGYRGSEPEPSTHGSRSARLPRRPEERMASEGEDDERTGAWMIQTSQPHEHAEDPLGMSRPIDRDEQHAAEEHAESLSELAQARLVATPGRSKEVLLSDDAFDVRSARMLAQASQAPGTLSYPEWDYRRSCYLDPGASVELSAPQQGSSDWVARTLREHATMIRAIRGRFEVLRARRVKLRKQEDGDELDLDAYTEAYADLRAGCASRHAIYQTERPARRDVAILLLVDVSGSTDGWVAAERRVIDVEKEALLLVCIALGDLGDPFAVLAFSGESRDSVRVRTLKHFVEPYGATVACRIAALEPEASTRTGAALRHAAALLMQVPARHRLLLLLSDGKPNDVDEYEGRYGVEDTRQAVVEASLQGIHPFCLTIDRQAVDYVPYIFGVGRYALLPRPEQLPYALLDWLKHLIAA